MIPAFVFLVVFGLLWLHYRNLNLLLLGEEAAVTLGVNLQQFRIQLILLVSLLTGVLVAVSGSIGFVGLIIPHIVRLIVGSNYKYVIPISALIGGIFLSVGRCLCSNYYCSSGNANWYYYSFLWRTIFHLASPS